MPVCDNCGTHLGKNDPGIEPLDGDWYTRLDPGGEVPYGICPCGAFMYLDSDDPGSYCGRLRRRAEPISESSAPKGLAAMLDQVDDILYSFEQERPCPYVSIVRLYIKKLGTLAQEKVEDVR